MAGEWKYSRLNLRLEIDSDDQNGNYEDSLQLRYLRRICRKLITNNLRLNGAQEESLYKVGLNERLAI